MKKLRKYYCKEFEAKSSPYIDLASEEDSKLRMLSEFLIAIDDEVQIAGQHIRTLGHEIEQLVFKRPLVDYTSSDAEMKGELASICIRMMPGKS